MRALLSASSLLTLEYLSTAALGLLLSFLVVDSLVLLCMISQTFLNYRDCRISLDLLSVEPKVILGRRYLCSDLTYKALGDWISFMVRV